jgi:hypothetical protein
MTKVIEAVRQLRGEAHPVQVQGLQRLALAHGTGGLLGHPGRHGSATADPGAGVNARRRHRADHLQLAMTSFYGPQAAFYSTGPGPRAT